MRGGHGGDDLRDVRLFAVAVVEGAAHKILFAEPVREFAAEQRREHVHGEAQKQDRRRNARYDPRQRRLLVCRCDEEDDGQRGRRELRRELDDDDQPLYAGAGSVLQVDAVTDKGDDRRERERRADEREERDAERVLEREEIVQRIGGVRRIAEEHDATECKFCFFDVQAQSHRSLRVSSVPFVLRVLRAVLLLYTVRCRFATDFAQGIFSFRAGMQKGLQSAPPRDIIYPLRNFCRLGERCDGIGHDRRKSVQGVRAVRGRLPEKGDLAERAPHERERVSRRGGGECAKLHRLRILRDHVPRPCDNGGEIKAFTQISCKGDAICCNFPCARNY